MDRMVLFLVELFNRSEFLKCLVRLSLWITLSSTYLYFCSGKILPALSSWIGLPFHISLISCTNCLIIVLVNAPCTWYKGRLITTILFFMLWSEVCFAVVSLSNRGVYSFIMIFSSDNSGSYSVISFNYSLFSKKYF